MISIIRKLNFTPYSFIQRPFHESVTIQPNIHEQALFILEVIGNNENKSYQFDYNP
jgi:hypothetical protein